MLSGTALGERMGQQVPVHRGTYTKCTLRDGENGLWN